MGGSFNVQGQKGGEQAHTLSIAEIPTHIHLLQATNTDANRSDSPNNTVLGPANNIYGPPADLVAINPGTVANVGGSQAHLNMQPFLTLMFCIALQGVFPSRN